MAGRFIWTYGHSSTYNNQRGRFALKAPAALTIDRCGYHTASTVASDITNYWEIGIRNESTVTDIALWSTRDDGGITAFTILDIPIVGSTAVALGEEIRFFWDEFANPTTLQYGTIFVSGTFD